MLIGILTLITLVLQVAHLYFYGEGNLRVAYKIGVGVFLGFMVLETALALNKPDQIWILGFHVTNGWGLYSCIKGLRRLTRSASNASPSTST